MKDAQQVGLECFVKKLANVGITVQTVLYLVPPTVKHANTQMVCVPVRQVGWVITVQTSVSSPMEKTVSIRAVDNALTGLVIDSPETVGVILSMVKHVKHPVQLENIVET